MPEKKSTKSLVERKTFKLINKDKTMNETIIAESMKIEGSYLVFENATTSNENYKTIWISNAPMYMILCN